MKPPETNTFFNQNTAITNALGHGFISHGDFKKRTQKNDNKAGTWQVDPQA